jgi:hypothetical protein
MDTGKSQDSQHTWKFPEANPLVKQQPFSKQKWTALQQQVCVSFCEDDDVCYCDTLTAWPFDAHACAADMPPTPEEWSTLHTVVL